MRGRKGELVRLIDGDTLLAEYDKIHIGEPGRARKLIAEQPTIDSEPVRHGQWVFSPDHAEGICTMCNFKIYGRPYNNTYLIVPYNYCPNCGAKMDGGTNETD